MRKIIISEMVSVDGYFAGVDGDISWHVVDEDFNKYASEMLSNVDLIIFGKTTYDLMASYWPLPEAAKNDPQAIADFMNTLPKLVFSKSMERAEWAHTAVAHEINKDVILEMKQQEGKDMVIFGSGTIVQQFAKLGLIDEYRIIVAPVVLGKGKALFDEKMDLKLIDSKQLACGDVILRYEPK